MSWSGSSGVSRSSSERRPRRRRITAPIAPRKPVTTSQKGRTGRPAAASNPQSVRRSCIGHQKVSMHFPVLPESNMAKASGASSIVDL